MSSKIQYVIAEVSPDSKVGFQPYGAGLALWKCKDPEVIISGPAETGKTRTALEKLDALMWHYPGAQAILVRKTYNSLKTSVLLTFERKVLGAFDLKTKKFNQQLTPVQKLGGEHPTGYIYPNGSRIYLGGMDVPDKVLSSEWDIVYVNQAEELTLNDWEIISTRTTGRAGNMPYAQMMADCNPGTPTHWIRARASTGRLTFLESRHEDNPVLFDPNTHKITKQGERSMSVLNNLTGVRLLRLRYGKWAVAEGAVYEEFDRSKHIVNWFQVPEDWPRWRAVDFGYTNPFVCQWWTADPDGRLYLYREIYMTRRLVEDFARQINLASAGELILATICDHDAEDRATLERYGIPTTAAMKAVSLGIQAVQTRLRSAGDGRPRLFVLSGALIEADQSLKDAKKPMCTEDEFETYIWIPTKDSKPNKEAPLKENDHGMDPCRYLVAYIDGIKPVEDLTMQKVYVLQDDYEI